MLPLTAFQGDEHRAFHLHGGLPAAVLIHGFPGTPDEMRPLAHALHTGGWTVSVPLLPGFGADLSTLESRTSEGWLAHLFNSVVELNRSHTPVMLVGNSMGGALAVSVAAKVHVDSLVLLAPFYRMSHILWSMLPAIRLVMPRFKPFQLFKLDFENAEVRQGIANFLPDADLDDPDVRREIEQFTLSVRVLSHIRTAGLSAYRRAAHITAPTLIVQGSHDTLVRPEMTQQFSQRFQGQVTYTEVPAEHDLVFDDRPAWPAVKEAVLIFAASRTTRIPQPQVIR